MVKSRRVPGKGRIRASNEKLSEQVPKNGRISVSPEKWQTLGEYREKVESVRLSKNCPVEYRKWVESCEYRKMVESGRVPGKGRNLASTEILSAQVLKMVESV